MPPMPLQIVHADVEKYMRTLQARHDEPVLLEMEKEALRNLADKGVTIVECDKDAFRKRVAPQTDNFIKARPEAKPVVDMIRATQA